MTILVLGLLLFLGMHSIRMVADGWRARLVERIGEPRWQAVYGAVSGLGFVLLIWGFGLARAETVEIWSPPLWSRHLTAIFTLPAMILIAAAYVPKSRIKARIGHPMVVGTALWALAHLIANGRIEGMLLFGGILIWAMFDFRSLRRRDRIAGISHGQGTAAGDGIAIGAGIVGWLLFVAFLHAYLMGVQPL